MNREELLRELREMLIGRTGNGPSILVGYLPDKIRALIARIEGEPEPKVLAEGVGAELGQTGVWMVWEGELGQLPWTQDRAVQAIPVALIEREP